VERAGRRSKPLLASEEYSPSELVPQIGKKMAARRMLHRDAVLV
jgi:hypothetical protein